MRFERQIRIWMITVLAILFLCAPAFAEEEGTSLSPENGIPLVIVYVDETQEDIDAAQEADQKHEYGIIQAMNESERRGS